ncbi:MAG: DUF2177 family protein [Pseudomonadota bacterium]
MDVLLIWLATTAVFLGVDAVWLKTVMRPLFERHVGALLLASPRLGVAAGFYVFYCLGIAYFAVLPALEGGGLWAAVRDGAILGLLAYGTYEATNLATLKGWHWSMSVVDTLWGGALSALAAAAGYLVA